MTRRLVVGRVGGDTPHVEAIFVVLRLLSLGSTWVMTRHAAAAHVGGITPRVDVVFVLASQWHGREFNVAVVMSSNPAFLPFSHRRALVAMATLTRSLAYDLSICVALASVPESLMHGCDLVQKSI